MKLAKSRSVIELEKLLTFVLSFIWFEKRERFLECYSTHFKNCARINIAENYYTPFPWSLAPFELMVWYSSRLWRGYKVCVARSNFDVKVQEQHEASIIEAVWV